MSKQTKLKPFQLDGCRAIFDFKGRALLADEQGLGKTLQALYWIYKLPRRRPAIIVAPASMKYTWQTEAAFHLGMRTEVLEGHWAGRRKELPGSVVIVNYDILKSWLPVLRKAKPRIVVFDEIHYIKNIEAQRTVAALELAGYADSVVGLSGTPLTNRPIELWSVLQAIRPDLFPEQSVFAWRYTKPFFWRGKWHYEGAQNLPELHRILKKNVMIRRLKREVLPELPRKSRRLVSFKVPRMEVYERAEKDFISWLKEISPARAKRAKRAEAITRVGYLIRLASQLKLGWTGRWIQDFLECNPGEKLVAFTMHTDVIQDLQRKFTHISVVVDGSVTGRKRQEMVRNFQSNKKTRLFLGNWQAAGVGLTLTASHNFVALDLPWTPGDLIQGEDRIHRIGQTLDCSIHYLVALGTIEEKQVKVLHKKKKVLEAILNGSRPQKDLDIFGELIKGLTNE